MDTPVAWNTPDGTPTALPPADVMLSELIRMSAEAIVAVDERQRVVLFSPSAEEMFGYTAEEVLGQHLNVLLPPSSWVTHERLAAAAMEEGTFSRGMSPRRRVMARRHDGREFEAMISIAVVRHGATSVATAVVRDVSALSGATAALRASEARFREIVEQSPAGIASLDAEGNVLEMNPAFRKFLRLPLSGDLPPVSLPALLVDADGWRSLRLQIERASPDASSLYRVRTCDGSGELIFAIRTVRREDARQDRVYGDLFAIDVTDRERLEETVRRTERLDLIGRLAGGIAHDFNNLLLLIRLSASMLSDEEDLSDTGRSDLAALERAAIRAGELTHQLLAIGRRQVMRPVTLDLAALVSRQEDFIQRLLGEDVLLALHLPPAPAEVVVDESQVERILANLATNARHAMSAGGRVEIRVEVCDPDDQDRRICPTVGRDRFVRLQFTDTGCGMDESTRRRIFDPFFTTKELGEGTGLGLASVYGIVKQSGGHLCVTSEPGSGTTFHVYLPPADAADPTTGPALDPARKLASALPARVLLVEDDRAVSALLQRVLSARGIQFFAAKDAEEAMECVRRAEVPFDVVISDIVLPGMSGPQLVDRISALDTHATVKALFISGYSPEAAHHRGAMRPGSAFLAKPFPPEELLRALSTLVHS